MERSGILATASNLLRDQQVTVRRRFIINTGSALIAACVLLRLIWKPKRRPAGNIVPEVSGGLPVFGHAFQISKDPLGFIRKCKAKHGSAFSIKLPTQRVYVLTGTMIPELLTASRKHVSFHEGIETVIPLERVVHLSYQHKRVEEDVSSRDKHPVTFPIKHNFRPHQIGVFSSRIQKAFTEVLSEELNLKSGEKVQVQTQEFLLHAISRISCVCFAGSHVGTNKRLIHSMATLTRKVVNAGMMLTILPGWIADVVVRRHFSVEHQLDLLMELLVPLLNDIRSGKIPDNEATFVSMSLNLPKADGSLRSPEDVVFHFKGIALASIHTTAQTTLFALHELACRPQLMKELREAISNLDERTPEAVNKISLLDSFLREVMRYDIDNLNLQHLTLQDLTLSTGQIIPKGSLVAVASEEGHKNTDLSLPSEKSLDEFDPYRFMNVTEHKSSSTIGVDFLPFGLGPHSCPGRYFATTEIKYILAELLMRFKISTPSGKRAPDCYIMGMSKCPPKEDITFEAY